MKSGGKEGIKESKTGRYKKERMGRKKEGTKKSLKLPVSLPCVQYVSLLNYKN